MSERLREQLADRDQDVRILVRERDRYRKALEQLRHLVVSPGDMGREEIRDAGRRVIEEALDA